MVILILLAGAATAGSTAASSASTGTAASTGTSVLQTTIFLHVQRSELEKY